MAQTFRGFAAEHGHPIVRLLAKKVRVHETQLSPSMLGRKPISSKIFSRLANILNVPLAELEPFSREGTGLSSYYESKKAKRSKSKAIVHVKRKRAVVVRGASQNGDRHEPRGFRHNRLRGASREMRETVQAFMNTTNKCIMEGETHSPPLPVGALHMLLTDYAEEKGIRVNVLLDPDYQLAFNKP
jgi:hypothetical protein